MKKQQIEIKYISDPKIQKAISKDIPSKIISCFNNSPLSAAEVSKLVDFPNDKIYYHIKKLLSLNIIFVSDSHIVKGILQKKYMLVAKKIIISPNKEVNKKNINSPSISPSKLSSNPDEIEVVSKVEPRQYTNNSDLNTNYNYNGKNQLIKYNPLLAYLNGMSHAMTYVCSDNYIVFMKARLGLQDYSVELVKEYTLPFQHNNVFITNLVELINLTIDLFVDDSEVSKQFVAISSSEYNYHMEYVINPSNKNQNFKDYMNYRLSQYHSSSNNNLIIGHVKNNNKNNKGIVCISERSDKIMNDYLFLKKKKIQLRYNTSLPQILYNLYYQGNNETTNGNSIIIYIEQSKTHFIYIKNYDLNGSKTLPIGKKTIIDEINLMIKRDILDSNIDDKYIYESFNEFGFGELVNSDTTASNKKINLLNKHFKIVINKYLSTIVEESNNFLSEITLSTLFIGVHGKSIKNLNKRLEDYIGCPVKKVDDLYVGFTKKDSISRPHKRLVKHHKNLFKNRVNLETKVGQISSNIENIKKSLFLVSNPDNLIENISNIEKNNLDSIKKVELSQIEFAELHNEINKIDKNFDTKQSSRINDSEEAFNRLDKLEQNNLSDQREVEQIINGITKEVGPESVLKANSMKILKQKILELEKEELSIKVDIEEVENKIKLLDGHITNHEKSIQLAIREKVSLSSDFELKQDEYQKLMQPFKAQSSTMLLKNKLESETTKLLQNRSHFDIDLESKRMLREKTYQNLTVLKKEISPIKKKIFHFEESYRDYAKEQNILDTQIEEKSNINKHEKLTHKNSITLLQNNKNELINNLKLLSKFDYELLTQKLKQESKLNIESLNNQKLEQQYHKDGYALTTHDNEDVLSRYLEEKKYLDTSISNICELNLKLDESLKTIRWHRINIKSEAEILRHVQNTKKSIVKILEPFIDIPKGTPKDISSTLLPTFGTAERSVTWAFSKNDEIENKLLEIIKNYKNNKYKSMKSNLNTLRNILVLVGQFSKIPKSLLDIRDAIKEYLELDLILKKSKDKGLHIVEEIGSLDFKLKKILKGELTLKNSDKTCLILINKKEKQSSRYNESIISNVNSLKSIEDSLVISKTDFFENIKNSEIELKNHEDLINKLSSELKVKEEINSNIKDLENKKKEEVGKEKIINREIKSLIKKYQSSKNRINEICIKESENEIYSKRQIEIVDNKINDLKRVVERESLTIIDAKNRQSEISVWKKQAKKQNELNNKELLILSNQKISIKKESEHKKYIVIESKNDELKNIELDEINYLSNTKEKKDIIQEKMLIEFENYHKQEHVLQKKLNIEIKKFELLLSKKNKSEKALEIETKSKAFKVNLLEKELLNFKSQIEIEQKSIHKYNQELKEWKNTSNKAEKKLSAKTIEIAEKVAILNNHIKNKETDAYLSFVVDTLSRDNIQEGNLEKAKDIISKSISDDKSSIKGLRKRLRDLKEETKNILEKTKTNIKNLEDLLNPFYKRRDLLLVDIRKCETELKDIKEYLNKYTIKYENISKELSVYEAVFLELQDIAESKLVNISDKKRDLEKNTLEQLNGYDKQIKVRIKEFSKLKQEIEYKYGEGIKELDNDYIRIKISIDNRAIQINKGMKQRWDIEQKIKTENIALSAKKNSCNRSIFNSKEELNILKRKLKQLDQLLFQNKINFNTKKESSEKKNTTLQSKINEKQSSRDFHLKNIDHIIQNINIIISTSIKGLDQISLLKNQISDLKHGYAKIDKNLKAVQKKYDLFQSKYEKKKELIKLEITSVKELFDNIGRELKDLEYDQRKNKYKTDQTILDKDKINKSIMKYEADNKKQDYLINEFENSLKLFESKYNNKVEGFFKFIENMNLSDNMINEEIQLLENYDSSLIKDEINTVNKLKESNTKLKTIKSNFINVIDSIKILDKKVKVEGEYYQKVNNAYEDKISEIEESEIIIRNKQITLDKDESIKISKVNGFNEQIITIENSIESSQNQFLINNNERQITLNGLNGESINNSQKIDEMSISSDQLKSSITPLETESKKLEDDIEKVENNINVISVEIDALDVRINQNQRGIKKSDKILLLDKESLEENKFRLNNHIQELKQDIINSNNYVQSQHRKLDSLIKNKIELSNNLDTSFIRLNKNEEEILLINQRIGNTKKVKDLFEKEKYLSEKIKINELQISHCRDEYESLRKSILQSKINHKKNLNLLSEKSSNLEIFIISEKNIQKELKQKLLNLNKQLDDIPRTLAKFETQLSQNKKKKENFNFELKDIIRKSRVTEKRIKLYIEDIEDSSTGLSDVSQINYMANIGLLLDPNIELNIVPEFHTKEFKYFIPARLMQFAALIFLFLGSLFTLHNQDDFRMVQKQIPANLSALSSIKDNYKIYKDLENDSFFLNKVKKDIIFDKVYSKNIVSTLKYFSQVTPPEFKVTSIKVYNNISEYSKNDKIQNQLSKIEFRINGFINKNIPGNNSQILSFKKILTENDSFNEVEFKKLINLDKNKTNYRIFIKI